MEVWALILVVALILWLESRGNRPGAIGMVIGAAIGSFVGIAAFGSAISGTIPCAIIGYLLGAMSAKGS